LTLATIVTLPAIGQPWVAGIVATTGLAVIVAIFVTGQYQPAPVHIPEVAPRPPVGSTGRNKPRIPAFPGNSAAGTGDHDDVDCRRGSSGRRAFELIDAPIALTLQ
jgi:hypothetical protein